MVASAPAAAHHSAAMFDFRNPVTTKGTVKMIEVINPHSHIVMAITDKQTTGSPHFVETGHSQPSALSQSDRGKITDAALAGALIGLQQSGAALGWGFQLQSPAVVTREQAP